MNPIDIIVPCKEFREVAVSLSNNQHWFGKLVYVVYGGFSDNEVSTIRAKFCNQNFVVHRHNVKGIYQAMNFGVSVSTAPLVSFFGSTDIIYFRKIELLQLVEDADLFVLPFSSGEKTQLCHENPISIFFGNRWCHQSIIYKVSTFKKYGCFDEHFRIAGDFASYISFMSKGANIHIVKDLSYGFGVFSPGGVSGSGQLLGYLEEMRAIRTSNYPYKTLFNLFCLLRYITKRIRLICSRL